MSYDVSVTFRHLRDHELSMVSNELAFIKVYSADQSELCLVLTLPEVEDLIETLVDARIRLKAFLPTHAESPSYD